jgi:F-type H+-transporting ATPase subunit b
MISINATLVVQVIQFLILVFILNRLMFRPILKLIKERSEHIESTKNEIESIELETRRVKEEYFAREADARKDATQERSRVKNAGMAKAEEFINDSRKEVSAIRAEADKEAEEVVKKTRPLLRGEAEALAEEIMERVIGRRGVG